jgi:hypothetical protein
MSLHIFPYSEHDVVVNLSKDKVHAHFLNCVQLSPYGRFKGNDNNKELYGVANKDSWKMFIKTSHKNNLKPEVTMRIRSVDENQSKLTFEFYLPLVVKAFLIFWVSAVLVTFLLAGFWNLGSILFALGMISFAVLLTLFGYYTGLGLSLNFLKKEIRKLKA